MNNSRRDFIKKAALLSGSAALFNMMPATIQKALAINPAKGSSFYDAEHIVFLMQENRSFDHLYGTLKGVRGFNDPRAIDLPNKNKVWLQTNPQGDTYAPFRLNVKETKAPWMGSTPHGWADQTDARNKGKYDRWLEVKKPYNKDYNDIPLTLGYCDRADFPFYYSLADAFTICDQHFSSSITGTHPNRWYWMTGTVREQNKPEAKAHLWNISDYSKPTLDWKTFPERLQEHAVSWRIYQNELTLGFGLNSKESNWLGNFGTNVMEYFKAYNVRLHTSSLKNTEERKKIVREEIKRIGENPTTDADKQRLIAAQKVLLLIDTSEKTYTQEAYDDLTLYQRALNENAFSVNKDDPDFHTLTSIKYDDQGEQRELEIPKGDILHQFRQDVKNNKLPTVSWLMSPGNFSDHPGMPWFGSWYVNEVMEILLENPEIWKKTIFILTYDENDGFFDHVPPYAVPNPYKTDQGKVSKTIDTRLDFVTNDQQTNPSADAGRLRESSIGLGYRVPLIIASPWTRGGYVNSEVFDHTSSLQFLEHFIAKKLKKNVVEENISSWRRSICGDLTSVFRPYQGEKIESPTPLNKTAFLHEIQNAKFKAIPQNFKALSAAEIQQLNTNPASSPYFPKQEKGTKPANSIPYELYVDGVFNPENKTYNISFQAQNNVFGSKSAGAPFLLYAMNPYEGEQLRTWEYAVAVGDTIGDHWDIRKFDNQQYHFRVYAPNGFYREFKGTSAPADLSISCRYEFVAGKPAQLTGNLLFIVKNTNKSPKELIIEDKSYKKSPIRKTIAGNSQQEIVVSLKDSFNWYDLQLRVNGNKEWSERFAGHIETIQVSTTDPLMGGLV
ncbi:phosphocholine-specific phospholipase C [Sphingobacterium sp. MYb382]|uniref:phosphocholine-specific phospholipase C n=1 Tax=Sphingobacterium sp. MYb382 TaxID=2745278 RepID=UPI0030A9131E